MRPAIVIIGTGHRIQAGHDQYSEGQHKAFRELIEETRKKYKVKLIAEEMSADALPDYGTTETNGQKVAAKKNIQHRFVDHQAKSANNLALIG